MSKIYKIDEMLNSKKLRTKYTNNDFDDDDEIYTIDEMLRREQQAREKKRFSYNAEESRPSQPQRNTYIDKTSARSNPLSSAWARHQNTDPLSRFNAENNVRAYRRQAENYKAALDAAKVMNLPDNPTYKDITGAEKRMSQENDKAIKSGKDASRYQKALEMLKEYKKQYTLGDNTSPEDRQALYKDKKAALEKAESGEAPIGIDDTNIEEVKKALGSTGNHDMSVDEAAEFYVKYRTGAIQYDPDSENHKRYLGLKALIEAHQKKDTEAAKADLKAYERDYPNDFHQSEKQDPNYDQIVKDQYVKSEYVPLQDMDPLTVYRLYERGDFDASKLSAEDNEHIQKALNLFDGNRLKHMTSNDEELYYYILSTKGKEEAEKYLESLKPVMQKTETELLKAHAAEASQKFNEIVTNTVVDTTNPAPALTREVLEQNDIKLPVAGVAAIPLRAAGAIVGNVDNYAKLLSGEEVEPYSSAHALSQVGRAALESDAKYIDEKTNGFNIGGMTAGDMYQAAVSGVESIGEAALLSPQAAAFLMSTQSAEQKAEELYERGATPQQIFIGSTAAAAFEYITEKVSLDTIVNKIIKKQLTKKTLPRFLLSALESSGVEGSEEIASSVANYFTDIINMRDKSERQELIKKYMDEGKSKEEAEKLATRDFLRSLNEDFAGGFIGGFVGGGAVSVAAGAQAGLYNTANRIAENQAVRATGAAINDAENIPALLKQAKESTDTDVQKKAAKLENLYKKYQSKAGTDEDSSTVKPSRKLTKTAGDLFDMLDEREFENARTPIDEMKAELGDKIAKATGARNDAAVSAIVKQEITRAPMTAEEEAAISSPAIQNVIKQNQELITNTDIAFRRASQNINDIRSLLGGKEYDSFDVSDDGRDYIGNTPVKPQKVTAVTRDNMSIDVGTGEDAKATDISFADPQKATILKTMLDIQNSYSDDIAMTPEFVNAALKVWDDGKYESVNAFLHDVEGIYRAANTNAERYVPEVLSDEFADILTREAVASKNANISLKQQKIENAKTGTRKEGKVIFEAADGSQIVVNSSRDLKRNGIALNDLQATSIDTVTALSNATGITFRFFQSELKDGKYISKHISDSGQSPNGYYKDGEIYVDINAGAHGQGLILFTVSHELTHFMRDFAPEQFDKYAAYLFENYAKHGGSVRQAVHEEMNKHQKLTYDVAYEEVVARLSEAFLRDVHLTEKSRELYNTDKGLWQSIKSGLEKIVDRIEKYFAELSPDSRLGKIGAVMARENRDILDRFVAGIREAADNAAYTEKTTESEKSNTSDKKRLEQSRDSIDRIAYKYAVKDNDTERAQQIVDRAANQAFSDSKVRDKDGKLRKVYHWTNSDFFTFETGRSGKNQGQTHGDGIYVSTSPDEFSYAGSKRMELYANITNPFEMQLTDDQAREVLERYGATKHNLDKYDGLYRNHAMAALTSPIKVFDYLKEYAADNNIKVSDILKQLGFDGVHDGSEWVAFDSDQLKSSDPITYDDDHNYIPLSERFNTNKSDIRYQSRDDDYLSAVNRGDMETAQRMVDEAAKAAGYNTPKLYHGTQSFGFTKFDLNKMDDGISIFLTSTPETASTYSGVDGTREISKNTFESIKNAYNLSPKELVDLANDYYKSVGEYVEYRQYSLDDINNMADNVAPALQHLKEYAKKIKQKYWEKVIDDFDDSASATSNTIDSLINGIENSDYGWTANFLERLIHSTQEFNTEGYKKLVDTLSVLSELSRYGTITTEEDGSVLFSVKSKMFYKRESIVSIAHDLQKDAKRGNYATYAKLDNPLVISAGRWSWDRVPVTEQIWEKLSKLDRIILRNGLKVSNTRAIAAYAKDNNYDGVIFKNLLDNGGRRYGVDAVSDVYVVFDSAQVKSADPVTYDNDGNVIPLSERFDKSQQDIRYDERDSDYLSAVEKDDLQTAQRMVDEAAERAFADSKVRSREGKLKKVYHGTGKEFNVFDNSRIGVNYDGWSELGKGFYATDNIKTAKHYAERSKGDQSNIMEGYIDIKKPLYIYEALPDDIDLSSFVEKYNVPEWVTDGMKRNAGRMIDALIDNDEDVQSFIKQFGYDGIIEKSGKGDMFQIVFFDSNQFKSADPVTYDDNGKVIPLSERFNSEEKDIRYDDREDDLIDDDLLFSEYTDIGDVIKRQYTTHSEAIGEVLKNTADIDIAAGKVKNIVSRLLNARYTNFDAKTKQTLAIRLQAELENVKRSDPEDIVNNMIDAVRNVIQDGMEKDPHIAELIDELKGAFSGRYYLTDDQINDLKENGYTLNDFKNAMMGKATIVNKDKARRSVAGNINASPLSLEGVFDEIHAEEIFGITRDKWDTEGYHLPVMLMEAFEKLNDQLNVPLRDMTTADDMDYIATQIAAEFTAAVVQEKYNSRKNPYVKELVNKFEARKKEAIKKRNEYYQGKMKELREQRDRKIDEQKAKTKEARQNATVQRKRAELKERIRKMHKSLRDMAMKPKAKKYIPSELLNQSIDVMAAVNLDSGLQGERADKFRQKLRDLSHTLLKLKSESGDAEIDAALSSMLDNLSDRVGNTPLGKMSLDQLKMVHDTLKAVQTNIRNRIEVIGAEKTRYIYDVAFKMIGEIDDAKVRKILGSKYVTTQLSPERFFNMICGGAKNNAGLEIYRMLDDGQLKQIELETRFARMFEGLVNDEKAKSLRSRTDKNLVDIGLVDEQGNKVKITRGMMLSLYMHLMNDDNIRHVMGGGLSVPFLKSYYTGKMDKAFGSKLVRVRDSTSTARDIAKQIEEKRGKINDDTSYEQKQKIWDEIEALEQAYDAEVQRGIEEYINPMRTRIEKQLTDYDKEWIKTAKQFFDVESKNELNKTTMELYGFEKAVVKNYFPIHSDTAFTEQKFETIVRDMSLENMGMMKSRVGSANPIFLEDITDVINKQISNVAQYCGMVIPMANVKRILNVKGSNSSTSVMATLRKYDGKAKSYIEKLLGDLVGANKGESSIIDKARHGLAGAALTMNLKVAIKQAASYPTAAAELGYIPLAKALVKGGKNNWALSRADKELIYKYSPLLAYRSMGYSNQELGDLKDSKGLVDKVMNSPKLKWAFGWIQAMDTATVGRLWYASQYYVDKSSPDLKKGSDEYYKEVARVFNNVVERTQPNYTVLQRPQLLRSTNAVTKMFTMFMTQRLQNFNIVYDAGITLSKMKSDFKNGKNGVTINDVKQAKSKMAHAVSSQLLAAGVLVGMTFLADALMHKMNPWRDDDDELTGESVGIRALMYLGESLAGSVWGGSEVFDAISSYLSGGTWYGISANGIDTLRDLATNIYNFANKKNWKNAERLIKSLSQYAGIPYQNAKNIYDAVRLHAEDIANGQFLSYESGVSRTAKINTYRAWSAYELGKYSDSKAIIKEMKGSAVQAQLDKGKTEAQAKKSGYSDVRKKIKELLCVDYLKSRQNYYHGNRNEDDYKKIASITNFMTAAEVYEKPDVGQTLKKWWSDAEKKAKENEMTMKEYLNTL